MSDIPPPPPMSPPPGYTPYGGGPVGPTGNSQKAVWALVCGIVGLICCGPLTIVAIVLGRQAQAEIDQSGGALGGRGMAQAGFVIGIIGLVVWIGFLALNAL